MTATPSSPPPSTPPSTGPGPALTSRLADALAAAIEWHGDQVRKTSQAPYVSHPLQVAGLVLEHGGDEDLAVAALLHDVIEDTPVTRDGIAARFGDRVADVVQACSDAEGPGQKAPWRGRKERYLAHLREAGPDVALVSGADKLHNARSLLAEHLRSGEATWTHFKGGRDGTLWYYRELVEALRGRAPDALVDQLEQVVLELHVRAERAPA